MSLDTPTRASGAGAPDGRTRPRRSRPGSMRVAINLLTEDPQRPSGAHWFWTRVIPAMADQLTEGEELHLLVSPASRHLHQGYGPRTRFITYPWSNERRNLRTLSEHLYTPLRLPLSRIDVFNTLMAPLVSPTMGLVVHMKTMHAYTAPDALAFAPRLYRRMNYPRSARLADTVIINSKSMRDEVLHYLDVDPGKLALIYEAVDHETFRPGDAEEARRHVESLGITKPFTLFVSSLWRYKNCDGLLRAWAQAFPAPRSRQLVIVGHGRDGDYAAELRDLASELGIAQDVVFVGGVALEETPLFYRAAEVFVYPSFNETFGLPILEAMACGCPVVTSDTSSMPEIAGGAAVLCDPHDPASIASAITRAVEAGPERLRSAGLRRAAEFRWERTATETLAVYRDVTERRRSHRA
ncbi:MAG TPA: glycosyltransferase [Acidimicrobiales bacterium]|nr:glycosyltransferase [Acidimicrobiales bacterium]